MAPPTWIALSKASGDERYLTHADQEFWTTTNYLYDTGEHLFFRDSRYFTQRDAAGHLPGASITDYSPPATIDKPQTAVGTL
jgi:rhamnogalacturonyl hydrolase YesR